MNLSRCGVMFKWCSEICSRKWLQFLWVLCSVMLWLTLNYVLKLVLCLVKISLVNQYRHSWQNTVFRQSNHFWSHKPKFEIWVTNFECIKFYFRIKKYEQKLKMMSLNCHLMTFWRWSSTTWWSRFWGFRSSFWVTIWFRNATIWLVRTSIIRLTTWSTTWSLLTSLFIFKSWFVALSKKN